MKKILITLACLAILAIIACAGTPVTVTFDGSLANYPPDYTYYAGEGYGFPQIHPIGGMGGGGY